MRLPWDPLPAGRQVKQVQDDGGGTDEKPKILDKITPICYIRMFNSIEVKKVL